MTTKKNKKEQERDKPNNFHVRVKPGTADWLRKKINRDAPTVPAVIKDIVEAERRRDESQS